MACTVCEGQKDRRDLRVGGYGTGEASWSTLQSGYLEVSRDITGKGVRGTPDEGQNCSQAQCRWFELVILVLT